MHGRRFDEWTIRGGDGKCVCGRDDSHPDHSGDCACYWRPIETAPRDGTFLWLAARRDASLMNVALGSWELRLFGLLGGAWMPPRPWRKNGGQRVRWTHWRHVPWSPPSGLVGEHC